MCVCVCLCVCVCVCVCACVCVCVYRGLTKWNLYKVSGWWFKVHKLCRQGEFNYIVDFHQMHSHCVAYAHLSCWLILPVFEVVCAVCCPVLLAI